MNRVLNWMALACFVVILAAGKFAAVIATPEAPADNSGIAAPAPTPSDATDVPGGRLAPTPRTHRGILADVRHIPERDEQLYVQPMYFEPHTGPLTPRRVCEKDFYLNVAEKSWHHEMIVKFTEESMVRWNGGLYSKSGANLSQVVDFLTQHPTIAIRRSSVKQPEDLLDYWESNGEKNTGKDLANLNNYYVLEISDNPDYMALIQEVIQIDVVETAYYLPKFEVACLDQAPDTPDFRAGQDYQDPAPLGVDANFAWNYYPNGGAGATGYWCFDIENDWTEGHEDFADFFTVYGGGDNGVSADHGDAVVGVFAACNNGADGMTGISWNVRPKAVSWSNQAGGTWPVQWENAFNAAAALMLTGEAYLIEIHAPGPSTGNPCNAGCGNCGQYEYIAVEYWQEAFDAVETHTSNGLIVYEAGGNGQMNLDNAIYGNRFQRWFRDSNAIMVGAGTCDVNVNNMCWSSYGSRLDCSGWGQCVWTLGYGDHYTEGTDETEYTDSFSGTSSSTPVVAGSGNCVQGIAKSKYGVTMNAVQMENVLSSTGTPWGGTRDIGERPDLAGAINMIEPDCYPAIPGGWSYSFTPRDNNTANNGSCLISASLSGNANDTYLNFAGFNSSNGIVSPAPEDTGTVYTRLYIDNVWVYWVATGSPWDGSEWRYWNNWGPITVRGGRHQTQWWIDPLDAFSERSESNNWIYRQFAWSPLTLTNNSPLVRDAPPLQDWGSPTYLSGDGFRATGTWWTAVGVLPQDGQDIDITQYPNVYSSTSGYSTVEVTSSYGAGSADWVLANGNVLADFGETRMYQAIRADDASTLDYAIEADGATTIVSPYETAQAFSAYEVLDVFEFAPGSGNQFFVAVKEITGDIDLQFTIVAPGANYYDRADIWAFRNSAGVNGTESGTFTADANGWYACVVFKPTSDGYANSGNYVFQYNTPLSIDLEPGNSRAGWDYSIVARNTNDATTNDAVWPAAIQGNTTTYVNVTWHNSGGGLSTAVGFNNQLVLDNTVYGNYLNLVNLGPMAYSQAINQLGANIRGGRHAFGFVVDNTGLVAESDEGNQVASGQWVWSPLALAHDTPLNRLAPPLQGSFPNPNNDGFGATPPGNSAAVVGILPVNGTADFDVNAYSNYVGTFSGYSLLTASSAFGSGSPDYVLYGYLNDVTWYPGIINFDGENGNYNIEMDRTVAGARVFASGTWAIPNPDTLGANSVLNLYEVQLTAGTAYAFMLDVISGTANVGMRIHRDHDQIYTRGQALAVANSGGNGVDETMAFTPAETGWYALIVEKTTGLSTGASAIYNLSGQPDVPATIDDLVIQPFILFGTRVRLGWNHVNSIGGQPIAGRRYVIYRNASVNIIPVPADSVGGTTDSTWIEPSLPPIDTKWFYRVIAKGN